MRGWFDLFRENGGPTLYAHSNRTPVLGDVTTVTLLTVFATLYLAFFIIFPGVRRERFTTFLSVTLSMFVGSSILLSNNGGTWHYGEAEIASAYKAFSDEKIMGNLGVYIGLGAVNVSLDAMPIYYNGSMDVHFNERFTWSGPEQLKEEYQEGLVKGLPFPILTVAEYMAVDAEGFCWGRTYRKAGYYTSIYLWAAFVMWLSMNLLIVVVPRYGAYMMTATGAMMLFANFVYFWLLPDKPLQIHIEQVIITFDFGWCFYLCLTGGFICTIVGGTISVIDLLYPHKFSTILEMDYGTPFDRHTIIEDSHETKQKKKTSPKLEEPATVGFGGLLRRLSKRDRDRGMDSHHPGGHDNYAYEMEAPKSPWRYPHLMFRSDSRKSKGVSFKERRGRGHLDLPGGEFGPHRPLPDYLLRRTDSKDSSCSSLSSAPNQHVDLRTMSVPPFAKQFRRTDSSESSNSSLASFGGLGAILNRGASKNKAAHQRAAQLSMQQQQQLQHAHQQLSGYQQHAPLERNDSGQSAISRGMTVSPPPTGAAGEVTVVSGGNGGVTVSTANPDEVAIIVGSRKNSTTKAVRRNSAEHQRTEAAMW